MVYMPGYRTREEILAVAYESQGKEPSTLEGKVWWRDQIINYLAIKLSEAERTNYDHWEASMGDNL